jgi:hypothetical protein
MKKLIWVLVFFVGWGFCFGQVDLGNPNTTVGGVHSSPISNELYSNNVDNEPDRDPEEMVAVLEIKDIDCMPKGVSTPKIFAAVEIWKNVDGGSTAGPITFLSYLSFRVSGETWLSGIGEKRAKISIKNIPSNTKCYILKKTADLPIDTWINYRGTIVGHCPESGKSAIFCEDVATGGKMKVEVTIIAETSNGFPSYLLDCGNSNIEGHEINPSPESAYFVILESILKYDSATETLKEGLPMDSKVEISYCCDVTANPVPDQACASPFCFYDMFLDTNEDDSDDPNSTIDDFVTYGFIDIQYPRFPNPSLNLDADISGIAGIYTYDDPSDASTYQKLISGTFGYGKPLQLPLQSAWECKPMKLVLQHPKVQQGNVNVSVSSMDLVPVVQPAPIPIPNNR